MKWTEVAGQQLMVIKLSGEIDLQHSPKLRQVLQAKVSLRTPALLLDFTEVKYIDSSGLATLVEYYKNSRPYSGKLALAGLSARVRSVFDLVRLSDIFGIYPSVVAAEEALLAEARRIP